MNVHDVNDAIAACTVMCCFHSQHSSLQYGIEKFNEEINKEVFRPRGMLWKTQRSIMLSRDKSVAKQPAAWISIALREPEVRSLEQEEHIFYYVNGCHKANPPSTKCFESVYCCGVPTVI